MTKLKTNQKNLYFVPKLLKIKCLQCQKEWNKFKSELKKESKYETN